MKYVKKIFVFLLLIPIWIYRNVISPWTPSSCRHTPTCSQYAVDALKAHGPFKGFILATNRFFRCHPWGTYGYDPVPKILIKKINIKPIKHKSVFKYDKPHED